MWYSPSLRGLFHIWVHKQGSYIQNLLAYCMQYIVWWWHRVFDDTVTNSHHVCLTMRSCTMCCVFFLFKERGEKALCRIHLNLRVLTWMRIIVHIKEKDFHCRYLIIVKYFQFLHQNIKSTSCWFETKVYSLC